MSVATHGVKRITQILISWIPLVYWYVSLLSTPYSTKLCSILLLHGKVKTRYVKVNATRTEAILFPNI